MCIYVCVQAPKCRNLFFHFPFPRPLLLSFPFFRLHENSKVKQDTTLILNLNLEQATSLFPVPIALEVVQHLRSDSRFDSSISKLETIQCKAAMAFRVPCTSFRLCPWVTPSARIVKLLGVSRVDLLECCLYAAMESRLTKMVARTAIRIPACSHAINPKLHPTALPFIYPDWRQLPQYFPFSYTSIGYVASLFPKCFAKNG